MKLINKDALLAEIKRRIKINKECMLGLRNLDYYQGKVDALNDTISSLDTLEVKEVNLEKEIRHYRMRNPIIQHREESLYDYMANVAKHFFELGLKAQKGE